MKKLILTLVFVFAIGSFSFANNHTEETSTLNIETIVFQKHKVVDAAAINCISLAYAVNDLLGGISYETFNAIVESCEDQQK